MVAGDSEAGLSPSPASALITELFGNSVLWETRCNKLVRVDPLSLYVLSFGHALSQLGIETGPG